MSRGLPVNFLRRSKWLILWLFIGSSTKTRGETTKDTKEHEGSGCGLYVEKILLPVSSFVSFVVSFFRLSVSQCLRG